VVLRLDFNERKTGSSGASSLLVFDAALRK
jgi:hypothetical protein